MATHAASQALRRGAAVGVTAVGMAAAGGSAAESRAAPETLSLHAIDEEALQQSTALLKEELKAQGFLSSSFSDDGNEWFDVVDSTLDLAESVAADETVQKKIMEKSRDQALVLRLLTGQRQPSIAQPPSPLSASYEELPRAPAADDAQSLSSSIPSPSLSAILSAENESLKAENALLKAELHSRGPPRPVVPPAIARLQACARGRLTRRGFYDDEPTALRLALSPPRVAVRLAASATVDRPVEVCMSVRPRVALRQPRSARAASRATCASVAPKRNDAAVISVSIVVGLLALLISRNPGCARTAASAAAAAVAMIFVRASQRAQAKAQPVPCA